MKTIIGKFKVRNDLFPNNLIIANKKITQFLLEHRYKSAC